MYFFGRRNISAVKQLYKKGDNISMTNYRATSLLFFFWNLSESNVQLVKPLPV